MPPIVITPSQTLWRLELWLYGALVLFVTLAIFPFIHTAFYWPIVWLGFVLLVSAALRIAWRKQQAAPLRLSVIQGIWRVQTPNGEVQVEPCGEILMWEAIILVPVRAVLSPRKPHHIVALADAMSANDWRRLRVWLKIGLRNNL